MYNLASSNALKETDTHLGNTISTEVRTHTQTQSNKPQYGNAKGENCTVHILTYLFTYSMEHSPS
jgi:hypothetical protein